MQWMHAHDRDYPFPFQQFGSIGQAYPSLKMSSDQLYKLLSFKNFLNDFLIIDKLLNQLTD